MRLGLGDPAGDEDGIGAGFQGGAVLPELGVAVGDVAAGLLGVGIRRAVLGVFQLAHGVRQRLGAQDLSEPVVEAGRELVLAEVDRAGWSTLFAAAYSLRNMHR